jgi:hypothetical protein
MIGVDRQEINNSAKATSSRMVRGVAGLSNIAPERIRACAPSVTLSQARKKMSEFQTCKFASCSYGFDLSQHWQGHCRSPETSAKGVGSGELGKMRRGRLNEGKTGMKDRQEAISLLAEAKEEETVDSEAVPVRQPEASVIMTLFSNVVFHFRPSCYCFICLHCSKLCLVFTVAHYSIHQLLSVHFTMVQVRTRPRGQSTAPGAANQRQPCYLSHRPWVAKPSAEQEKSTMKRLFPHNHIWTDLPSISFKCGLQFPTISFDCTWQN